MLLVFLNIVSADALVHADKYNIYIYTYAYT